MYRSQPHFTVLLVCTGNVCRSPAGERLLMAALGADGVFTHSAGTNALVGNPIDPRMAQRLREGGIRTDRFAARALTESMIDGADLVLAATREHRADVVDLSPVALRRAFTLREFARLLAQLEASSLLQPGAPMGVAERLSLLAPIAASHRTHADADEDDIPDPYRRSDEIYQDSFRQIVDAVSTIVRVVTGKRWPAWAPTR